LTTAGFSTEKEVLMANKKSFFPHLVRWETYCSQRVVIPLSSNSACGVQTSNPLGRPPHGTLIGFYKP
jgi:hypothetical protein